MFTNTTTAIVATEQDEKIKNNVREFVRGEKNEYKKITEIS